MKKILCETKLTSVKVIDHVLEDFQKTSTQNVQNLQTVINRSLYLYYSDKSFRDLINSTTALIISGSF